MCSCLIVYTQEISRDKRDRKVASRRLVALGSGITPDYAGLECGGEAEIMPDSLK